MKIELWKHGNPLDVKEIGKMTIINQGGSRTATRGNYEVQLWRKNCKSILRTCRVMDYPKLRYSVWVLVMRALKALFERGNIPEQEEFDQKP